MFEHGKDYLEPAEVEFIDEYFTQAAAEIELGADDLGYASLIREPMVADRIQFAIDKSCRSNDFYRLGAKADRLHNLLATDPLYQRWSDTYATNQNN